MYLHCVVLCGAAALISAAAGAGEPADAARSRSDWFYKAKWGVFTHYMADTVLKPEELTVENWNRVVDSYDVERLAEDLAAMKAGYFVITLGQNSGFYCSPNATYDRFVGVSPSKLSKRDLIADLYKALQPKGIRLMVYLPSGAPDRDPEAMAALEWQRGDHGRQEAFQRKWEAVIREWSQRWGRNVSGWWFDGCYWPDAMYRFEDAPSFESFAAAARAGNPDSIVAFNPGVKMPVITMTPFEDYTAGEVNEPGEVAHEGRRIEQAQFHVLSHLGAYWCAEPPRYADEEAARITVNIVRNGGVVSWDVPPRPDGRVLEVYQGQLRAIGAAVAEIRR